MQKTALVTGLAAAITLLTLAGCSDGGAGATAGPGQTAAGHILAVGGGGTPDDVLAAALELAGGPAAKVVILPWASGLETAGESSIPMWEGAGAADVTNIPFDRIATALPRIETADLIWMPGGSQGRFMERIAGTGIARAIKDRYQAGAVVGGTSAGAAVQSRYMITGDADLEHILAGRTEVATGLDLWPDAIIDQHFLARQRMTRLISAVLDRPGMVGIGIDERTAVLRTGDSIEVYGEGNALIFDARGVTVLPTPELEEMAATGLRLHVLRKGMTWDIGTPP
jgi:cyanophycinase